VLALHTSVVPPTLNLHHNCVQPPPVANLVPRVSQPLPAGDFALCNSFGFGGMNACVALRSHPPHAISGGAL
jgi:3-oxoacyl-(acyl-carrier-protein) synthase